MITVRRKDDLDHARFDWRNTRHHFAFPPDSIGACAVPLIVWNEDAIAPGGGVPPHAHRDLEIVAYVIDGAMKHWDDKGNSGYLDAGDVQVMGAGSGIRHEEKAHLASLTRLFHLCLAPRCRSKMPDFKIRPFPRNDGSGPITLLASATWRSQGDTD